MRKLLAALSALALLAVASPSVAGQKELLGRGTVALKTGFGVFTSDALEESDHSTYVELEGYCRVAPRLYLGASVGSTFVDEGFLSATDVHFYPLELNLKYAHELSQRLVFDGGGGISWNRAKIRETNYFGPDRSDSDRLLGGQLFGDLTWKFGWFTFGLYAKYQVTEEYGAQETELGRQHPDFNNFRGGLQFGVIF